MSLMPDPGQVVPKTEIQPINLGAPEGSLPKIQDTQLSEIENLKRTIRGMNKSMDRLRTDLAEANSNITARATLITNLQEKLEKLELARTQLIERNRNDRAQQFKDFNSETEARKAKLLALLSVITDFAILLNVDFKIKNAESSGWDKLFSDIDRGVSQCKLALSEEIERHRKRKNKVSEVENRINLATRGLQAQITTLEGDLVIKESLLSSQNIEISTLTAELHELRAERLTEKIIKCTDNLGEKLTNAATSLDGLKSLLIYLRENQESVVELVQSSARHADISNIVASTKLLADTYIARMNDPRFEGEDVDSNTELAKLDADYNEVDSLLTEFYVEIANAASSSRAYGFLSNLPAELTKVLDSIDDKAALALIGILLADPTRDAFSKTERFSLMLPSLSLPLRAALLNLLPEDSASYVLHNPSIRNANSYVINLARELSGQDRGKISDENFISTAQLILDTNFEDKSAQSNLKLALDSMTVLDFVTFDRKARLTEHVWNDKGLRSKIAGLTGIDPVYMAKLYLALKC